MPSHKIKDFYNLLSRDSFVLIYLGAFDDELTPILMDINDAGKSEMKSSRKKISYLIAECFQNIIRHSDKTNRVTLSEDVPEMFILRDRNRIHHLVTTNIVQNEHTVDLSSKLDSLQNLSASELKEMYMQIFQNSETSAKGGAGLGLIDMARNLALLLLTNLLIWEITSQTFLCKLMFCQRTLQAHSLKTTIRLTLHLPFTTRWFRKKL